MIDGKSNGNPKNRPSCILHIGMHKTGSSSIQNTLQNHPKADGFEYLNLSYEESYESENHSEIIYCLFSQKPESYHTHLKRGRIRALINQLNKKAMRRLDSALTSGNESAIISGEDISVLNEAELLKLRDYLSQYCRSIQVVGYVRLPVSYIQSAFQQNVKDGIAEFELENFYPCYRDKFEKFDRVFGSENVRLIKFQPETLLNNDVVVDFCSRIGFEIDPNLVSRVNESISLEATALLYVYHKYGFGYGGSTNAILENTRLIQALSSIGNKKIQFSPDLYRPILEKYSDDIRWIESRLGASVTEPLHDSDAGISSEDDLIAIALECVDDLAGLIAEKIRQQPVTPQKIADWIHPLRNQLSNNPAFSRLVYSIDHYNEGYIGGWIHDKNHPLEKLPVEIRQAQRVIATGVADQFRQDLVDAKMGDGHCAFSLRVNISPTIDGGPLVLRVIEFDKEFQIQPSSIKGVV